MVEGKYVVMKVSKTRFLEMLFQQFANTKLFDIIK